MPIPLQEQTVPATASAGYVKLYASNDAVPRLYSVDDAGIALPYSQIIFTSTSADFTGTNVNTAQPVFNTTEDVLTVTANVAYLVEAYYHIHTTGTSAHTLGLLFGGTATYTNIDGTYFSTNQATEVLGALSAINFAAATVVQVSASLSSASHHAIIINGIIRVANAGTIIPQYQWSSAPGVAGVTLRGSFLRLTPIGVDTIKALPSAMWG